MKSWQMFLIACAVIVLVTWAWKSWNKGSGGAANPAASLRPIAHPDFILYPGLGYPPNIIAHLGAPDYKAYPQTGYPPGTRLP